jgi:hypothetical protein
MTVRGREMGESMGEEDIRGLEEEIDSAVDQLFVERKGELAENLLTASPILGAAYEEEKFPILKSIETLETELLSLEWDITKENLNKTREEILALPPVLEEEPEIRFVLNLMEKVLSHMIRNEENIRPPLIKFLLDSKDTVKLLMKKETDREIDTYKQLAYAGIEARFSCLEGLGNTLSEERDRTKEMEAIFSKINLFSEKMEEMFKKIDQHLAGLGPATETPSPPVNVTVFKVGEKLFAVGSDKVFKLFKVTNIFHDRYSNKEKIRLKGIEVKMIDLNRIFSIQGGSQREETKILTVKDNGEYKGLIVDQVVKKLSTRSEMGEYGEYFLGMIHWKYQEHPVEIPILNLKKF